MPICTTPFPQDFWELCPSGPSVKSPMLENLFDDDWLTCEYTLSVLSQYKVAIAIHNYFNIYATEHSSLQYSK